MPDNPLIILGGGGHACVVAEAARMSGWTIAGHVAPEAGSDDLLGDWLGTDETLNDLLTDGKVCALGLGFVNSAGARRRTAVLTGLDPAFLATVIHPQASIAATAELGAGSFVAAGALIGTRALLGVGVLVNTGAIVEHHSLVGRGSHVATGARLTGKVSVGEDVLIGAGAVVRQGVKVGDGAVIGAGCVVLADVPAGVTWGGNPGRHLR